MDENFPPVQTGPGGTPSFLYNGYRVFPRGRGGWGVELTPTPASSAEVLERVEL